jgi:hypothetical protein
LLTLTASCSLETRWQRYLDERATFENQCYAIKFQDPRCSGTNYTRHFHERWDDVLGRVPASDAMWAEAEALAREVDAEVQRHADSGKQVPSELRQQWGQRGQEINERYAVEIAQQLADREQEAQARRQQAIIALAALGLIASQVAAVATQAQAPRANTYQVPVAATSSRDAAIRRQAEADWAVRTGGATGGAKDEYIRNALRQRTAPTCTNSLNALNGRMVCVDSQGTVRAQAPNPAVPSVQGTLIATPSPLYEPQQRNLSAESPRVSQNQIEDQRWCNRGIHGAQTSMATAAQVLLLRLQR